MIKPSKAEKEAVDLKNPLSQFSSWLPKPLINPPIILISPLACKRSLLIVPVTSKSIRLAENPPPAQEGSETLILGPPDIPTPPVNSVGSGSSSAIFSIFPFIL